MVSVTGNKASVISPTPANAGKADEIQSITEEEWSFLDCVDCPGWGKEISEQVSALADGVLPHVKRLTHQFGIEQSTYDMDEVT